MVRQCTPPLPVCHTFLEPLCNPCLQLLCCSSGLHRQCSSLGECATGTDSGKPAAVLVMCDVLYPDSSPHITNTRALLVELLSPDVVAEKPMFGFEQARLLCFPLPRDACLKQNACSIRQCRCE